MRSRRALVLLILFVAGGVIGCNSVVWLINKSENQLASALGLPVSSSIGVITDTLWEHHEFREFMFGVVGDRKIAQEFMSVPPMAMIFSFVAFLFSPVLVMFTASGRIAEEVGSRSVRYALMRTSRTAWCLGKYLGQAFMLVIALMLGAIGAWCVFRFRLTGINNLAMAQAMIVCAWKVWLYCLSFMGLAMGISQLTNSASKAMALGFIAWLVLCTLWFLSLHYEGEGARQVWTVIKMFVPAAHRTDIWRLDFAHQVQGGVFLVTLGFSYFFLGHIFFLRRDL